jgi:hypothetical protein
MLPIESKLTNRKSKFVDINDHLQNNGFSIGGNWDYKHGYFDRPLDEQQQIFLRLPFSVLSEHFDPEGESQDTMIQWGQPFVLHHQYQQENDDTAKVKVLGALFDQFQTPVNHDATVDEKWRNVARDHLEKFEKTQKFSLI